MSIQWKQKLKPQNRSWNETCDMLISIIDVRPVLLLCKGCWGEHMCFDPSLTLHCACGNVTRYQPHGLFYGWTSCSWMGMVAGRALDTTPYRRTWISSALIVDEPLISPKLPIDTRVSLWRLRGVA